MALPTHPAGPRGIVTCRDQRRALLNRYFRVRIRIKPGHFARFRSFALNVLRANVHTSLLNAVLNDQPHIEP